jgi:hypothetical protein
MTRLPFYLCVWRGSILLFAALVSGCMGAGQVTLAITNNTDKPIQSVMVKFTGGVAQLGSLKIGERQEVTIKPVGESHIELDIYPVGENVEHRVVDTYFEAGYRGKIEITLGKEFTVHSVEQMGVR